MNQQLNADFYFSSSIKELALADALYLPFLSVCSLTSIGIKLNVDVFENKT